MGRKGIGKFAGFGIANIVEIDTISRKTGERTVFELDVASLTGDEQYSNTPMDVAVKRYLPPAEDNKSGHGTRIRLRDLTLKRIPNAAAFRTSMARRFLLLERTEEFQVLVNGDPISEDGSVEHIEFDYPRDFDQKNVPKLLTIDDDGWGTEKLANGETIKWRFVFYKEPIQKEELAGVSIFSRHKLAQRPFTFELSGGFGGQHAINYLSGRVQADYIDDQHKDLISTERQRINWESDEAAPLKEWGQNRIKLLLRLWQDRRASAKVEALNRRIAPFSERLLKLEPSEQRVVRRALTAIARIPALSEEQFADLCEHILAAWEGGRLQDLIRDLSDSSEMDADKLVSILAESRVMSALHAAERVRSQLELLLGLEERIRNCQLENAIRDYIAENPWMISPTWETFRVEKNLENLMKEVGKETLDKEEAWQARIDLALRSGNQLLVLEFMRPGKTADWDHLSRFERYIFNLRDAINARRSEFRSVIGLMVADKLERPTAIDQKLQVLRQADMDATDWAGLLEKARSQWSDYFDILYSRAPEDERMQALADTRNTRESG